jgi:hypothetical protein
MTQYLVAIHLPDDFDQAAALKDVKMNNDIDALNEEMEAAGAIVFVGGLQPARTAKAVRRTREGKLAVTDGPYTESKEHIGGFWVLECTDDATALAWGEKAAVACRAPIEVRAFRSAQ